MVENLPEEPISKGILGALATFGWLILIGGVTGGVIVIYNAPAAPLTSYLRYGNTDIESQVTLTARWLHIFIGASGIVGGLVSGLLMIAVADIGRAMSDLWRKANKRA